MNLLAEKILAGQGKNNLVLKYKKKLESRKQKTEKWHKDRLGCFTSSEIHRLLGKSLSTQTAITYINSKIAEQLGVSGEEVCSKSIDWGNEHETTAILKTNETLNFKFEQLGFEKHKEIKFFGGSADGIFENIVLEIKCPYSIAKHIEYLAITDNKSMKRIVPQYYAQIQSNMLIHSNNNDVDFKGLFVSFDPRYENQFGFHYVEINPDFEYRDFIISRVKEAKEILDNQIFRIKEIYKKL